MKAQLRLSSFLKLLVKTASMWAMLVGVLVLLGWVLDLPTLKSILPHYVTMKVNAAFCFFLLGAALWLFLIPSPSLSDATDDRKNTAARRRRLAGACVVLVMALALLTLSQYLFQWNLGIDELFFREEPDAIATSSPGRMAPATIVGFIFLAGALFLLDRSTPLGSLLAILLAHATALIAFVSLLGYLYGAESLSGFFSYASMALHTSFTFLMLSIGVLVSQPERGVVRLLLADDPGGITLRVLFPTFALMIVLLGLLRVYGERAGLYDSELGTTLYTVAVLVLLLPMIWWHALVLSRTDQHRRELTEALERQTNILNSVLDSMGDGVVAADMDGKFIIWNKAAERMLGLGPSNRPTEEWSSHYGVFLPDRQTPYPSDQLPLARALRGESVDLDEQFIRRPDIPNGVWLSVTGRPLLDQNGMQRGGVVVFSEISERKRAEEEMRQLNAELEVINTELEAFSYSVSHDLRAPLRHIDGFAELLRKKIMESLDDQSKRYLDTISRSAKHLGALIDDLLIFSRMGRTELRKTSLNPSALLRESIENHIHETGERNIQWKIHTLPVVMADRAMLSLVFQNLIGNAIKYTRPREIAEVEIGCTTNDSEHIFYIRDNGVGFDMKYVDKLFGVFQRLHRADEFEGTGIGLANVRRIISRHGGKTWAEGVPNRGATVYFTMPIEATNGSPGITP